MMVKAIGYTLFVMSQHDVILMFGEVCWHSLHIILHALSLLIIVAYNCNSNTHKLISASSWRPEQNTALNAKTEQFITAKISSNALKRGVEHTQCYVRAVHNCKNIKLCIQRVQKNTLNATMGQFTKNGCMAISLNSCWAEVCGWMTDTQGWRFETCWTSLHNNWKWA